MITLAWHSLQLVSPVLHSIKVPLWLLLLSSSPQYDTQGSSQAGPLLG